MFHGSPPSIELHILDFDDDVYGEEIRVDFCTRLRDIHRFAKRSGRAAFTALGGRAGRRDPRGLRAGAGAAFRLPGLCLAG
jgi:hypothetical protein